MAQRSTITPAHHVLAGAALERVFEKLQSRGIQVTSPLSWLADVRSQDYSIDGYPCYPYGIILTYLFHMYGDPGRKLRVDVRFAPSKCQQPMDCEVDGIAIFIQRFSYRVASFNFEDGGIAKSEFYPGMSGRDLIGILSNSPQTVPA